MKAKFASICAAACMLVLVSLPAFSRSSNPPQDQQASQAQSAQKGEKQNPEPGSGKEIGKGGEDVGKGAGKGAESLGKGTGEGDPDSHLVGIDDIVEGILYLERAPFVTGETLHIDGGRTAGH